MSRSTGQQWDLFRTNVLEKRRARRKSRGGSAVTAGRRLRLEPLEERRLLSITVNTAIDELDGNVHDGDVSLRDALLAAAPFEPINFAPALTSGGPITMKLTLGELRVTKDASIVGPGGSLITIDASGNDLNLLTHGNGSRVFNVTNGSEFTNSDVQISGLRLIGGDVAGDGGAIRNLENLSLTDMVIFNSWAGGSGGGVFSSGSLTMISSIVTGNQSAHSGGGIDNSGPYLTIHNSQVSNNSAVDGGGIANHSASSYLMMSESAVTSNFASHRGGGMDVAGQTRITSSTIESNRANVNGGGIYSASGALDLIDSYVRYNRAYGGGGGGVFHLAGATTVLRTTISGNSATGDGVGIMAGSGDLDVTGSTFRSNTSYSGGRGGAIFSDGGAMTISQTTIAFGRSSAGGGVWKHGGSLAISESTISGNFSTGSGGGMFVDAANLSIASSTISGNSAVEDGGGLRVMTGAGQSAQISYSTIAFNRARSYYSGLGTGGGVVTIGATIVGLSNTLLANNLRGSLRDDLYGKANAFYSLISVDGGALINDSGGNRIGTVATPIDARLAPLSNNGGPTQTHLLMVGSPAIDAGYEFGSPPQFDQRGTPFSRVRNGDGVPGARVDIGAFEVEPVSISGQKWNDLNADGVKQVGEPGLPGWTIYLDENGNGQFDHSEALEPDNYDPGEVLNDVLPGVTLSVYELPGVADVYSEYPNVIGSTGQLVFASSFDNHWYDGHSLRIDFAAPTSYVSIDAIGEYYYNYGALMAYDSNGVLLTTYNTSYLGPGWIETMTIDRGVTDIAYVVATGLYGTPITLDNLHIGGTERNTVTDAEGHYSFDELPPGTHTVAEVLQPGWVQTRPSSLSGVSSGLAAHQAAITALVPNRYDFSEGEFGYYIYDGGNDMYNYGNFLSTDFASGFQYTNGVVVASNTFGTGSEYFTAKFPGLFVLGAQHVSITNFAIAGNNGADGFGSADGDVLHTVVDGQEYTIFVKRVFNAGDPSINHIIMIPGDGTGVSHNFSSATYDDFDQINGLAGVDSIYYALVARQNGMYLGNADVLAIANEFLNSVSTSIGTITVSLESGQAAEGVDFGNHALPGSIHGTKWNDVNGDGVRQPGEPGLEGWTIYIDQNGNGQFDDEAIVLEPDDYPDRAPLTSAVPGVTLSVEQFPELIVEAAYTTNPTSTGTQVFISNASGSWHSGHSLRIDFDTPVSFVSIDAISDDSYDLGVLTAYDAGGNVVETYYTDVLGTSQVETMVIDRSTADIAYVIASGLGGEAINLDALHIGKSELSTVTDEGGNYWFLDMEPGNYLIGEAPQAGWQTTSPTSISQTLALLNANYAAITALVPNRFDFLDGTVGTFIEDGGGDMYDRGNYLSTDLGGPILYSNGAIPPASAFGPGSQYFTVKHPGLFALAATNVSINSFQIAGDAGADGSGFVDASVLHTTLGGREYTIFVKRISGAGDPSINQIIMVPGDGTGITQNYSTNSNDNFHELTGLANVDELYYALVASQLGGYLSDDAVLDIANEFLKNVAPTGFRPVTVGPGEDVYGVDFGNSQAPAVAPALLGDYNLDGLVNGLDYSVWRNALGSSPGSYLGADGSGDGTVGQEDFDVWKLHYGDHAAPAATHTIAQAEQQPFNTVVTIAGVVTCTTDLVNSPTSSNFFIQDFTGGVAVFGSGQLQQLLAGISVGDTVVVTGSTTSFGGQFEVQDTGQLAVVRTGHVDNLQPIDVPLNSFFNFSATGEALEGVLVRMKGVTFNATGDFHGLTNYTVTDGLYSAVVRVSTTGQDLVGMAIPSGPVDLIGIFSQFDSSNPGPGVPGFGYQLLLRTSADILPSGAGAGGLAVGGGGLALDDNFDASFVGTDSGSPVERDGAVLRLGTASWQNSRQGEALLAWLDSRTGVKASESGDEVEWSALAGDDSDHCGEFADSVDAAFELVGVE